MFNLLPESIKNEIRKEYNFRRMVTVFIFLIFIGATMLVFVFPSWIVSVYKEKQINLQAQETNQAESVAKIKAVSAEINKINAELKTIDTALEYKKVLPILNTILSKRPSAILVNEITYDSKGPTSAVVLLEGVSATRGSLLTFVKSLEDSNSFKSVDLPISNFAKDKNIFFSLTLTIEPSNEKN